MSETTGISLFLPVRICPYCKSARVSRSARRSLFERAVLSLLSLRPYRCRECERRYYGFTFLKKDSSGELNGQAQAGQDPLRLVQEKVPDHQGIDSGTEETPHCVTR